MSFGFRFKVILAFFLFTAIVSSALSTSAYKLQHDSILKEIQERTKNVAQLGSYLIDRPALFRLTYRMDHSMSEQESASVEQSADFRLLSDQLNKIRDIEPRLIRYAYIVRPMAKGSPRYIADADTLSELKKQGAGKQQVEPVSRFNSAFDASTYPIFWRAVRQKMTFVEDQFFYDPVYKVRSISAYAPILDDNSRLLAVLCIDVIDANVEAALRASRNTSLIIIGISLLLSLFVSVVLGNTFARGILALDSVVKRYAQKDFSARTSIKSSDEIGRLGFSLNSMAEIIENYAATLEKLVASFSRFVPRKFLEFLNRESISDVRLGDQIQKEMTILFSDIRSFTTLSESMTPAETFNFINSYLSRVGPAIRLHNGFIDKYIGDGIMALFPGSADNAVAAAIAMMGKVEEYNRHRASSGYQPIKIGIGIHTGLLMLGAIGEDERIDGSVISDAVNICSRTERLTKFYLSSIIISQETLDRLSNPSDYHIRFLDRVQMKGKNIPVSLYEVYSADEPHIIATKDAAKEVLEGGIKLYLGGKVQEAFEIFSSLHKDHPDDAVIRIYLSRCKRHLKQEPSSNNDTEEAPG